MSDLYMDAHIVYPQTEPKCRDCDDTGIFYGNVAPCHCEAYKKGTVHTNPYIDLYPMTREMIRPLKMGKPHIVWTGKRWMCSSQRFYSYVSSSQQAIYNANYNNAEVFARKQNRKGTLDGYF